MTTEGEAKQVTERGGNGRLGRKRRNEATVHLWKTLTSRDQVVRVIKAGKKRGCCDVEVEATNRGRETG